MTRPLKGPFRAAVLLTAAAVAAGSAGCGSSGPCELARHECELLARLNETPSELPAVMEGSPPVMLLVSETTDGRVEVDNVPVPIGSSSLRFERAMTKRRTDPAEMWAFLQQPDADTVSYWVPIDTAAMVRANIREQESGQHAPLLAEVPEMYVAVRIPFQFGAKVSFVSREGERLGEFSFDTMAPMHMSIPRLERTPDGDPPTCVPAHPGWPLASGFNVDHCPQVYEVHSTGAANDEALNLVFIPDGFSEDELETYRCGVGLMVEKLLSMPPYDLYSDSINVYRVDLAASQPIRFPPRCGTGENGKVCEVEKVTWESREQDCRALAERAEQPAHLYGRPYYRTTRAECLNIDMQTQGCPSTTPACQLLWPTGEGLRTMWRIAACAPAFDAVIIVANSGTWAGGGTDDIHPSVAVTTLNGVDRWSTRSNLMAHELGHGLGLLDEYVSSTAYSGKTKHRPDFHHNRNIVESIDGIPNRFPWEEHCDQNVAGLESYAGGNCFVSCGSACGTCDLPDISELGRGLGPVVGAFEGSYYTRCGYFRATQVCGMDKAHEKLCPACQFYLEGLFKDLGMKPNEVPHPTEDPTI